MCFHQMGRERTNSVTEGLHKDDSEQGRNNLQSWFYWRRLHLLVTLTSHLFSDLQSEQSWPICQEPSVAWQEFKTTVFAPFLVQQDKCPWNRSALPLLHRPAHSFPQAVSPAAGHAQNPQNQRLV